MADVHATAVVAEGAELGEGASIGPYCVIGPHVRIGAGARLMAHVVVDGYTTVGRECTLFPFACIGTQTQDLKYRGERSFVEIGDKTTLREYVTVNSGTEKDEVTRVGAGCHIMAYAHVAHGCQVGNGVIMANSANLAGHIVVEDRAVIGGLSGVHQFVKIGTMCMVGGMTRVTQDCAPYMMVVGLPAEVKGVNMVALERGGMSPETRGALKQAYRILFRDGLTTSDALVRIEAELPGLPEVKHLVEFVRSSERGICR